jgi:type II secretory pathway component PulF
MSHVSYDLTSAGPPRIVLEVVAGVLRGREFAISAPEVHVGRGKRRAEGTWLILDDSSVSRHHAVLRWDHERQNYRLRNMSESNRVQINGQRAEERVLQAGDTVIMGNAIMVVRAARRAMTQARKDLPTPGGTTRAPEVRPTKGGTTRGPEERRQAALNGAIRLTASERGQVLGHLAFMLEAGVSVPRAISALAEKGGSEPIRNLCARLRLQLDRGRSLARILSEFPGAFTATHVATVEAGVKSGRLPQVLARLSRWEERDLALTRAVRGSLTYPLLVLALGILLAIYLGDRVFSSLVPTLIASGKTLPSVTRALMAATAALQNPFLIGGAGIAALALVRTLRLWTASPAGRLRLDRAWVAAPTVGPLFRKLFIARFCAHLQLMSESGIPLHGALEGAADAAGNRFLAQAVERARERVEGGEGIAESLERTEQFPLLLVQMIAVGESSGRLPAMLDRLSSFYDAEVYDTLAALTRLLEPVVIAIMGLVVGTIALATLLPIYQVIAD